MQFHLLLLCTAKSITMANDVSLFTVMGIFKAIKKTSSKPS